MKYSPLDMKLSRSQYLSYSIKPGVKSLLALITLDFKAVDIEKLMRAFFGARKRGFNLRYATEITKDNISYSKQMTTMVNELQHLNGTKRNFYIPKTEYLAPDTLHEAGNPVVQIIYSNV